MRRVEQIGNYGKSGWKKRDEEGEAPEWMVEWWKTLNVKKQWKWKEKHTKGWMDGRDGIEIELDCGGRGWRW